MRKEDPEVKCPSPHAISRAHIAMTHIAAGIDLDHLAQVVTVRFLHCSYSFPPSPPCTLWKDVTGTTPTEGLSCAPFKGRVPTDTVVLLEKDRTKGRQAAQKPQHKQNLKDSPWLSGQPTPPQISGKVKGWGGLVLSSSGFTVREGRELTMLCLRILWTTGVNTSMTTMERGRSLQCWGNGKTWSALRPAGSSRGPRACESPDCGS